MPTQNVWDAGKRRTARKEKLTDTNFTSKAFAGNARDVHRAVDCGAVRKSRERN